MTESESIPAPRIRVVSEGGWWNTIVTVDGKPLDNVLAVDLSINVDGGFNTVRLTLENVAVDISDAVLIP